MKLWILEPIEDLPAGNPWDPWFDKTFGLVIRAETRWMQEQLPHQMNPEEILQMHGSIPILQVASNCYQMVRQV